MDFWVPKKSELQIKLKLLKCKIVDVYLVRKDYGEWFSGPEWHGDCKQDKSQD